MFAFPAPRPRWDGGLRPVHEFSPPASFSISAEPFESADAQRLVAALDSGLAPLYPPEQRFGPNFTAAHAAPGRGTFLVARQGGRAVGCGAITLVDPATAEVKRMFVEPDHRGLGIGGALLVALQAAAVAAGARRMVLETGIHQQPAIGMYLNGGFVEVKCWGEYAASPTSVCYEKALPGPTPRSG